MRTTLLGVSVVSVALCIWLLAAADCKALDLIHLRGTENVLTQCRHTGPGSCLGTINDVIDNDMNTAVMATSASGHEGAIDNVFITTEHSFKHPFELNEVGVKYYASGYANGATEYAREVGLYVGIEVKQGDTWKTIAEQPGGCRNNPTSDTTCAIEGLLHRSGIGESDVTGLRVSVVASALRVGGAGFSRSEAKLFDVQAFGMSDDIFCVEPGMDMHGHTGGGSEEIGRVDIWFADVLTAGCVEGKYLVAPPGQLPDEFDLLLRHGNPVQAWDFTFDGSFSMATLKFHYDESLLRGPESNLMVFHQRPGNGFEKLPVLEHDLVANTVTVKTNSFSYIALAVVPEPSTGVFAVAGSMLLSLFRRTARRVR